MSIIVTLSLLSHHLENTYWEQGVNTPHFLFWIPEVGFDCVPWWPGTYYVAQADHRHLMLALQVCTTTPAKNMQFFSFDFWDSIPRLNLGFKTAFLRRALLLLFNFLLLLVMCIRNKDLGPRMRRYIYNLSTWYAVEEDCERTWLKRIINLILSYPLLLPQRKPISWSELFSLSTGFY